MMDGSKLFLLYLLSKKTRKKRKKQENCQQIYSHDVILLSGGET